MNFSEDLKNAVLQIALQGKLTKQLETDSSVNDLITRITKEKTILAERKKARADKDYGPIQEDEIEFDIPKNWEWIRVSNIGVYKKGPFGSKLTKSLFVPKSKNTVKVFEQKNAIKKDASLGNYYITEEYYNSEMKGFSVEPGDIIVSCAGTIGETYVLPNNIEKGIINQALMRMNIVDSINLDFFLYYFDHILKKSANKASNGSAIKNIPPFDIFKAMLFPLPPIEEQQRIVEKLNQILPLFDEYGKEEDELITLCQKFPEEMKKSVLKAAMQGKLTKQLKTDSSVDELLKKIADEKEKLIEEGKVKKEKSLAEIKEEEIPFDIPENWRFIKLGSIIDLLSGRDHEPSGYNSKGLGVPYMTGASNISNGELIVNRWTEKPTAVSHLGDLLITCKGTIGEMAYNKIGDIHIARQIMGINTYNRVSLDYIQICLKQKVFELNQKAKSMIPGISREDLLNLIIPLPPIEEQQRIVEKLNTILPLIDSMAVYGTKKKAGRPKQEEALAFINSLLGTKKSTVSKPVAYEITELTAKAKEELPAIVKKYADLMGVTYNRITIRHQKTRWGSCTKTGNLSFNCLILKMPENVRDYVIVHELAHRKELNHSTKFWAIVAEYCPWYKEAKQWLKKNGQELMEL